MYKIAVMGDRDSIYGFAAIGLTPFFTAEKEEAKKTLKELVDGGEYAIVYIVESLAEELEKEINYYSDRMTPAIILIPGVSGNTGSGIKQVKLSVEKAVGSDIIFNT
ncbi:MAG: V-type ATP synthase subunit F [Lachnospiraceae bacterium]|nr:V-type ATP synthase subunit F [Lachnospiraceae bacterium]